MAVTAVTTAMAGAINYTVVTDSSADWGSVANSTYFYDKTDKLVHYKNNLGTILEIFSSSSIAVGTTPVTSGTDGRVFFQAGGVIQQSAGLTFNNGEFTVKTGTSTRFIVGNDPTFKVFNLCDSVYNNGFTTYLKAPSGASPQVECSGNGLILNSSFVTSLSASNQIQITTNGIVRSFYDSNGNVGIGSMLSLGARLDVRAQGALSTDIAFRVRNSADTANLIESRGNGHLIVSNSNFADVFTAQNSLESFRVGGGNLNYVRTTQSGNLTFVIRNGASSNALITLNAGAGNSVFWENLFGFDTTTKNLTVFGGSAIAGGNSGDSVMWVRSGTSTPSASFADMFGIYSADITAGNAAPHFRTENGSIIKLYQQSSAGIATVGDLVTVLQNLGLLS